MKRGRIKFYRERGRMKVKEEGWEGKRNKGNYGRDREGN